MQPSTPNRTALLITAIYGAVWLVCVTMWMWFVLNFSIQDDLLAQGLFLIFSLSLPLGAYWLWWGWNRVPRDQVVFAIIGSLVFVAWWQWSLVAMGVVVSMSSASIWEVFRVYLARCGLATLFTIGLMWMIWGVERASQYYEGRRALRRRELESDISSWHTAKPGNDEPLPEEGVIWNPLDPQAWMYGAKGKRLNQSLAALMSYTVLFFGLFMASSLVGGCEEIYELPAGGGEQKTVAQVVKVQKVIRKKFVVNPFSAILFEVPPIDEVKLQLEEISAHQYTVGYGDKPGAGYDSGTKAGMVRFIRVQYDGGDWNQDYGVGGDLNMLIEYGLRTNQKVAKQTEAKTIAQLKNFKMGASPPVVYITGSKGISVSSAEVKMLREYLLEKHGMIFGDAGSPQFHSQFLEVMRQVLPNIRPVSVPLDDQIHRVPFAIPFLPYVVAHGGKDALGWKVDGRWVCYYHPGDIGDAWADGHAGIEKHIYEFCYQLGTNVINYANAEYAKWSVARRKNDR